MAGSRKARCEWCGSSFTAPVKGPLPRYCRASHRQRAYEARKQQAAVGPTDAVRMLDEVLVRTAAVVAANPNRPRPLRDAYRELAAAAAAVATRTGDTPRANPSPAPIPSSSSEQSGSRRHKSTGPQPTELTPARSAPQVRYVRRRGVDMRSWLRGTDTWQIRRLAGRSDEPLSARQGHANAHQKLVTAADWRMLAHDLVSDACGYDHHDRAPLQLLEAAARWGERQLVPLGDKAWELDAADIRAWLIDHHLLSPAR